MKNYLPINSNSVFVKIIVICLFLCSALLVQGQNYPLGARQAGMAGCGVTTIDVWSAHHNQAALAFLDKPAIGLFAENRYGLSELGLQAGTFAYPTASGTFGITLSHFGYELYNESKVGVSFAKSFGKRFATGIQIGYVNKHFGDLYGNQGAPVAEIGFFAEPYDNFFIGAHIFNLTRAKIADYNDERLPTILRAGMGFKLSERLLIITEGEKDLTTKLLFRAGIEYLFLEQLYIRSGISSNPNEISFGIGYKTTRIRADIAFTTHQVLGISPHIGFIYLLNAK